MSDRTVYFRDYRRKARASSKAKSTTPQPQPVVVNEEVEKRCARLRRLITDFPNFQPLFDSWANAQAEKIKQARELAAIHQAVKTQPGGTKP